MLKANSRTLSITDIKVPTAFEMTTPGREKVDKAKQFYAVTGQFDHSILVDRNGYIFDGYARFVAAKELGLDKVSVVQIVPFERKKKADKPANKYEGMSNEELRRTACDIGGLCLAHCGDRKSECPLFAIHTGSRCTEYMKQHPEMRQTLIAYLLAEDAASEPKQENKPAEPAEPTEQKEPIKLYCVKDYAPGEWVTEGKIYELDGEGKIHFDDGYTKAFDNLLRPSSVTNALFPLVKRPAKVGERIYMEEDILNFISDDGHLSEVVMANDDGRIYNRGSYTMTADYYLVLDGYHPEPEKEPEYYNGKVVCVKADGYFTVGKVYEFCNGLVKSNTGDSYNKGEPIKSLEELGDGTWIPEFVEFKGEAND